MEKETLDKLFDEKTPDIERAARVGRFLVLEEMGYFGEKTNLELAVNKGKGSWTAKVIKRFSGTYGDMAGCHPADLEVAAEMLGVFDDVYDIEAVANSKHLPDREQGVLFEDDGA